MKTSCRIIEDLLPLYHDEVCSDESRRFVDEHLAECESCRRMLDEISADTEIAKKESDPQLKSVLGRWILERKRSILKGFLCAVLAFGILIGGYLLLVEWKCIPVPTERFEITDVCMIDDDLLAFHLYIDDIYTLNHIAENVTEDGILYITPKRSVIKIIRNTHFDFGPYNRDWVVLLRETDVMGDKGMGNADFNSINGITLTEVRLGSEKDYITLWSAATDIPEADPELEERYTGHID